MCRRSATLTSCSSPPAAPPPLPTRRSPTPIAPSSLSGQVVSDSIGPRIFSGVGGQGDFIQGVSQSTGGRAIIAMPSRTTNGESRIVATLRAGGGVVTTRAMVQYVCTEYGAVNLYGLCLKGRAAALTSIAHPDDREALERAGHAAGVV